MSRVRFIGKMLAMPALVAGYLLAGTILFQALLYWRYGQSLFDNMDLPGADFVAFANSPAVVRWPSQLIARALHLWEVQGRSGMVVMVIGCFVGWTWLIVSRRQQEKGRVA